LPNIRVVATPTLAYLGKTNNLSWAQPIDDTHTRVFCILRIPKGSPPQGLGTYGPDAASWFDLGDSEHQLYPGDYETQVGQGSITLHSEERLSSTDRGVVDGASPVEAAAARVCGGRRSCRGLLRRRQASRAACGKLHHPTGLSFSGLLVATNRLTPR
jgi:hypothetical protein